MGRAATLPETPSEWPGPHSWVSTWPHRSRSPDGQLPEEGSSQPQAPCAAQWDMAHLGKLEMRPNPSGFALHTAEICLVGFIFTHMPRTQRWAGKRELKPNRKKAGSLHFYF